MCLGGSEEEEDRAGYHDDLYWPLFLSRYFCNWESERQARYYMRYTIRP